MTISIIVAHDRNRLIGNSNDLPWKRDLPNDLKYFKQFTTGNTVIMGRNTFESIGKPLPQRINIVLTRDENFKPEGCLVFNSIQHLLKSVSIDEEMFIIGGSNVYQQFLPIADYLYVTEIDHEFEGDTYFPEYDLNEWKLIRVTKGIVNDRNKYKHKFKVYKRRNILL